MRPEFTGIEKRLDELHERLARLEPLRNRTRSEFDKEGAPKNQQVGKDIRAEPDRFCPC